MPNKTERILSYLPSTFRATLPGNLPQVSALYATVDPYGSQLLLAENSLAEVMQSHWVDLADRGAEWITDLGRIADLYGLAPRPDESVEEFRLHLKRYVRTFLEGTVTVQGTLRVTAEALGLTIADDYDDMDVWWRRSDSDLVTTEPSGDDAALLVLGFPWAETHGSLAWAAQIRGRLDLRGGVDLRQASQLKISLDGAAPVLIDLASGASDPASVKPGEMAEMINAALGGEVARVEDGRLILTSLTSGAGSRLEVQEVEQDAAVLVLGLAPLSAQGQAEQPARVVGKLDLSAGVDLSQERYLRLLVDSEHLAEVDCAGPDPAHTTLDQVRDAINDALGIGLASHDGHVLSLTSPTNGFHSTIAFQEPGAQDARERLFGPVAPLYIGQDPQPARLLGQVDLGSGVDLSGRSKLRLSVDGGPAQTVDCAGVAPANTQLTEIVQKINAALGAAVAQRDGRRLALVSPTVGPAGAIALELPETGDATELLLGLPSRTSRGADATSARLEGTADLASGVNLFAQHRLQIAVDGAAPVLIDLRSTPGDPHSVKPGDLAGAINQALGAAVASSDGNRLSLLSPSSGTGSSLSVLPIEITHRRRYVTRAPVTGEAADAIFGYSKGKAWGTPARRARLVGTADLSRGVDLRQTPYLRIALDGAPGVDIPCAGARPRATLINEVVDKINEKLGASIASHDGQHLILSSPRLGASSSILFETPRPGDALDDLLGLPPGTTRGQPASRVSFSGLPDLSGGIDLPAHAAIRIGLDGAAPVEIPLAGDQAAHKSLTELVIAVNLALGAGVAAHDGAHLALLSPSSGAASRLEFAVPNGVDVTMQMFGIPAPRLYQAAGPQPARLVGLKDLSGEHDLSQARYLRLSIDGQPPIDVDCAGPDPAHTTLDQVRDALNAAMGYDAASHDGTHLVLVSQQTGLSGRITLDHYTVGDARQRLLGSVPDRVDGSDPGPAILTGQVDLISPVDLSQRSLLRLAVDGRRPLEIDVRGAALQATFLDEIVDAINAIYPGLATATEQNRLQLTSPSAGEESRLELLPLRYLELVEYPPSPISTQPLPVQHDSRWPVVNDGVGDEAAQIEIDAPLGAYGMALVNERLGWIIRLLTFLAPGEEVRLWRGGQGDLKAEILSPDGDRRPLPPGRILVGPLGAQAWVPFKGAWVLSEAADYPQLQLNDPLNPGIVRLRLRTPLSLAAPLIVEVSESDLAGLNLSAAQPDGSPARLVGRLIEHEGIFYLAGPGGDHLARLLPGPGVDLPHYRGHVVAAWGPFHVGEPPVLNAQRLDRLYDVHLRGQPEEGSPVAEHYYGVTIGSRFQDAHSLAWQLNAGDSPSHLVKADELEKSYFLSLPRGRSHWRFLECGGSRFDHSYFNQAYFAGGLCLEDGVFDVSRFALAPPEPLAAVFAGSDPQPDTGMAVSMSWESHRPGAFQVNLPADLPPRFGGRFNQARFGFGSGAPELYEHAVTEPAGDPDDLVKNLHEKSALVDASVVDSVPLGWSPVPMPFRKPRYLTLGNDSQEARLYLSEEGIPGFIQICAREKGAWGNQIAVAARKSGPAMYDVTVQFEGGLFEVARQIVLGPPLPASAQDILQPCPVGLLQAKAAGVQASVTRDQTE